MEKKTITGDESVYPCLSTSSNQGITIRQHFAAMAMQGILASNPPYLYGNVDRPIPASVATEAVQYADALITSLNQTTLTS